MYVLQVEQSYDIATKKVVDYIRIKWHNDLGSDDLWKCKLGMKDWLQDQFGLNRGYDFLYDDVTAETNVWFDDPKDLILFKVVFG